MSIDGGPSLGAVVGRVALLLLYLVNGAWALDKAIKRESLGWCFATFFWVVVIVISLIITGETVAGTY